MVYPCIAWVGPFGCAFHWCQGPSYDGEGVQSILVTVVRPDWHRGRLCYLEHRFRYADPAVQTRLDAARSGIHTGRIVLNDGVRSVVAESAGRTEQARRKYIYHERSVCAWLTSQARGGTKKGEGEKNRRWYHGHGGDGVGREKKGLCCVVLCRTPSRPLNVLGQYCQYWGCRCAVRMSWPSPRRHGHGRATPGWG
ncbi:hypothetical protein F4802DRAFT_62684 [Xylaria palmicola]|nr:hypothetical protein F4802DRAFT_62684 [Xylaria palmicola]